MRNYVRAYDAQDRLTAYGDWTHTYTDNGELKTKTNAVTGEAWADEYDVTGNLLSVDTPSGQHTDYLMDGRNRRIAKKVNGTVVRQWLYEDGLNPIAELDSAGHGVVPLRVRQHGALAGLPRDSCWGYLPRAP